MRYGTHQFPVGTTLLEMAVCLQHRGADSAGVALFGPLNNPHLQMALPEGEGGTPELHAAVSAIVREMCPGASLDARAHTLQAPLTRVDNSLLNARLVRQLEERLPGATVAGMGRKMSVYKALGRSTELSDETSGHRGSHGIAHLRLATESRIDAAHAQPFWGRPYSDIAVTHNGHITNYARLRQRYEARGFTFASHNDSEIIGVYLGQRMDEGQSLEEALHAAARELDGSFSFIAATATQLGVARDPLATKPLLYVEDEEGVTLASEPRALYRVCGPQASIREIKPREVRTWSHR